MELMRHLLVIGFSLLSLAVATLVLRPRFGVWGVLASVGLAISVWAVFGGYLGGRASTGKAGAQRGPSPPQQLEPLPSRFPEAEHSEPANAPAPEMPASAQGLVLVIVGECRKQMNLFDQYESQSLLTGGLSPAGGADPIRDLIPIESVLAVRRASAALIARGPQVLEPLLKALEPCAAEIRTWHPSSRAGLDSVFESIFTAIGGEEASKALERYRAFMA